MRQGCVMAQAQGWGTENGERCRKLCGSPKGAWRKKLRFSVRWEGKEIKQWESWDIGRKKKGELPLLFRPWKTAYMVLYHLNHRLQAQGKLVHEP